MSGELEESKALLEAAIRGQRQVQQELIDTREQVSGINNNTVSLANVKGNWKMIFIKCKQILTSCLYLAKIAKIRIRKLWLMLGVLLMNSF